MRFRFPPGILILMTGGFLIISLIFFAAGVSLRVSEVFGIFLFAFSTTWRTVDALFEFFFAFEVFSLVMVTLAVFFAPLFDCYTVHPCNTIQIDE